MEKDASGQITDDPDAAVLFPLSRYVDFVQSIEDDKQRSMPDQEVIVAGIVGVPTDYAGPEDIVYQDAMDPDFQVNYGIGPGCSSSAGEAVPPVRIREFARAFEVGGKPNLFSICQDDYSDALRQIAEALVDQTEPACMEACVADTEPSTPDRLDPDCVVEEVSPDGGEVRVVPPCVLTCGGQPCAPGEEGQADGWDFPSDDVDACFRYLTDAPTNGATATLLDDMSEECFDEGWNLEFAIERRPGRPQQAGARTRATCQLSQTEEIDCPNL